MRKHQILPIILYLIAFLAFMYPFIIAGQTPYTDVPLNTPVLFYNDECNNCKQIVPLFNDFIKTQNINVVRINVNSAQNHSLCDKYNINELPSIALFTKSPFQTTINANVQTLYTYNGRGQIELNKETVIRLHSKIEESLLITLLEEMLPILGLICIILVIIFAS